MANEFEKLICKTLEENPGAELKFTRRVTGPDAATVTMEIQGEGRWLQCTMHEEHAHEVMVESLESLRRQRDIDRLASDD